MPLFVANSTPMASRPRPSDITNYALNELQPRERLYVESMMLVCEDTRRDALEMMEMARLLEEGFQAEAESVPIELDSARREVVFTACSEEGWVSHVCRTAAAAVAMAACVAFSVAAPQLWNSAMRPIAQQIQQQQGGESNWIGSDLEAWAAVLQAPSVVALGMEEPESAAVQEDLPTRILVPQGTVGMVDMPMPSLGGSDNN